MKVRVYYFHGKSQKFQDSNNIVYCCVTSSGGFSLADFNNNCHLKKMEKPQQSDNSRNNNNNSLYDQALGHSEKDELFFNRTRPPAEIGWGKGSDLPQLIEGWGETEKEKKISLVQ